MYPSCDSNHQQFLFVSQVFAKIKHFLVYLISVASTTSVPASVLTINALLNMILKVAVYSVKAFVLAYGPTLILIQ
jgi:hypothetical protein